MIIEGIILDDGLKSVCSKKEVFEKIVHNLSVMKSTKIYRYYRTVKDISLGLKPYSFGHLCGRKPFHTKVT